MVQFPRKIIHYQKTALLTVFHVFYESNEKLKRSRASFQFELLIIRFKCMNVWKAHAQGCTKGQKSGGAGSNAARRRCPAAPSDLPKSGGAAAPPAPPLGASLHWIQSEQIKMDCLNFVCSIRLLNKDSNRSLLLNRKKMF